MKMKSYLLKIEKNSNHLIQVKIFRSVKIFMSFFFSSWKLFRDISIWNRLTFIIKHQETLFLTLICYFLNNCLLQLRKNIKFPDLVKLSNSHYTFSIRDNFLYLNNSSRFKCIQALSRWQSMGELG